MISRSMFRPIHANKMAGELSFVCEGNGHNSHLLFKERARERLDLKVGIRKLTANRFLLLRRSSAPEQMNLRERSSLTATRLE